MSKSRQSSDSLGIPGDLPTRLRMALAEELQRMGTTYDEIAYTSDATLSPAQVLEVARLWNSLTPSQLDRWDEAARQENMPGGHAPCRN